MKYSRLLWLITIVGSTGVQKEKIIEKYHDWNNYDKSRMTKEFVICTKKLKEKQIENSVGLLQTNIRINRFLTEHRDNI